MGAHLRKLDTICYVPGCLRKATEGLFNTYNSHQGNYCSKHAKQKLKELQKEEIPPDEMPRYPLLPTRGREED